MGWRVVHHHDPVPRLHPVNDLRAKDNWAHEPEEVYYNLAEDSFEVCPSSGDEVTVVNRYENANCMWTTPFVKCVNDEHITYLNLTEATSLMPDTCIPPTTTTSTTRTWTIILP